MKNYLFAPFKDDDDKIEEFNAVVNALKYVLADVCPTLSDVDRNHYMESAIHGLRVFVGRLESYYDRYITHLKVEDKKLNTEYSNMKAEINTLIRSNNKRVDMIKELKAVNEDCVKTWSNENAELKAEIKSLKADIRHDAKVCDDYDDDLIKECKELQAENDRLKHDLKHKAHKVNTKHYPKEYDKEADEYFEHNPHEDKLFFLMVGGSGCNEDGDVVNTLNVGCDAIAEYDNDDGNISGNTYE